MTPPDPRRRRALIIGGALLVAIAAWNIDWWHVDDHEGMVTGVDVDETSEDNAERD